METQDLKKAGLKATLPRIRILQMLENSKQRHMSAEDVYKALLEAGEDVGLATIYRVLTQFEAASLVTRQVSVGSAGFSGSNATFTSPSTAMSLSSSKISVTRLCSRLLPPFW